MRVAQNVADGGGGSDIWEHLSKRIVRGRISGNLCGGYLVVSQMKTSLAHEIAVIVRRERRSKEPSLWKFFFFIAIPILLTFLGVLVVTVMSALLYTLASRL